MAEVFDGGGANDTPGVTAARREGCSNPIRVTILCLLAVISIRLGDIGTANAVWETKVS